MVENPSPEAISKILRTARRIAVVGMSTNPEKDAHTVPRFLIERGYEVVPVNPTASKILDRKAYSSLDEVPGGIDIVDVFRPSADVPPIAEAAIRKRAGTLWLQLGIVNEPAARKVRAAGVTVIQDLCIRTTLQMLPGGRGGA